MCQLNVLLLLVVMLLCQCHTMLFGYFMPMSHGVNIWEDYSNCLPPPLPLTRFSPGLFVALQELIYQPSLALIRLLQNIMHFQNKKVFFTETPPQIYPLIFIPMFDTKTALTWNVFLKNWTEVFRGAFRTLSNI